MDESRIMTGDHPAVADDDNSGYLAKRIVELDDRVRQVENRFAAIAEEWRRFQRSQRDADEHLKRGLSTVADSLGAQTEALAASLDGVRTQLAQLQEAGGTGPERYARYNVSKTGRGYSWDRTVSMAGTGWTAEELGAFADEIDAVVRDDIALCEHHDEQETTAGVGA